MSTDQQRTATTPRRKVASGVVCPTGCSERLRWSGAWKVTCPTCGWAGDPREQNGSTPQGDPE